MLNELDVNVNDYRLTRQDVGQVENGEQVVHFFARLGYDVDQAVNLNHAALGLDSDQLRHQIRHVRLVATDPVEQEIRVYLFEVRSVTVALTHAIARRFRDRPESALLVLTKDYETLDFVLVERELAKSQSVGRPIRQIIRPRTVTVNRRNPDPVSLRVLKRFTFTEEDSIFQWEKLRSAFTLAQWSEQYFNNRALFSDYFLKERLTDETLTPAWQEDVRPAGREAHRLLANARRQYSKQPERVIRRGLYEPLFERLGFRWEKVKGGSSAAEAPDYRLYSDGGDGEQPLALALTYAWNRSLDDADPGRDPDTPEEIPGALVVSVLESGGAPWVIVTNGKLWRLYSATASNKATNYYEVDLEEALAATDQITALKYWWLFFRRQAFTGFLDAVQQQSADYARALGERLKERVFEEIFPHFAAGFIHHMRQRDGHHLSEATLERVFQGTMTFLYRLMFVLYAESLELLPVNEARGYRGISLYQLKREIEAQGGPILDEAPARLEQAYTTSSTALYERLQTLFRAIGEGDEAFNLPTYNGGLFSPQTENGKFLAAEAIPDRYLALGLDRLCRDVDDKTQALAMIDFKSLGVRHLGSIYEGLLEFKLRVAGEKLAVVKEKGREVYLPFKQVQAKRVLATLAKGDVYLENDKRERKATGSYYTPDYIVKYIVEHTVGPVLERKFEELAPRLREAQKRYRQNARVVAARSHPNETPEKFWNDPGMRQLADDCLNVRSLDPAMGSGHFLVEVVDFVSNRLITFLNAWSENPVWALLARTRGDILEEMERQRVSIDAGRLTRVALLKRAVLKRCVYGVDLNEMAVELAKVSLWLDAFTLGAPLSFLDHHLKQGNSLIGARIEEVRQALEAKPGEQLSLLAQSKFTGMMLATDLMQQVSYLSDNTVSQVQESRQAYRDARDHLAPYKRVLDVYTSRWFGNEPTRSGFDVALEFLKRDDTQAWLENPETARLPEKDYMNVRQVAETAVTASREKCFFHWELEFPEVFFAPSKPGGQDVQLLEDGGFDAVVGNPPYVDSESMVKVMPTERTYISETYLTATGNWDLYIPFVELSYAILRPQGKSALITPNKWIGIDYGSGLRSAISNQIYRIADFSRGRVFEDAGIFPVITCIAGKATDSPIIVNVFDLNARLTLTREIERHYLNDDRHWGMLFSNRFSVFQKLWRTTEKLSVHLDAEAAFTVSEAYEVGDLLVDGHSKDDRFRLVVTGAIDRYENLWGMIPTTYLKNKYDYPVINRQVFKRYSKRRFEQAQSEKIIVAGIRYFEAILDEDGDYIAAKSTSVLRNFRKDVSSKMVLALLNSNLISFYLKELYGSLAMDAGITFTHRMISELPFPVLKFGSNPSERKRWIQEAIDSNSIGDSLAVMRQVQPAIRTGKTDLVHDLLAYLADRMIKLNKQKQAEVKRFLGLVEKQLKIQPNKNGLLGIDSLSGKTIIQNYLGDYQKGEPELPWQEFHYRLHQNRGRFKTKLADVLGEIQTEYEKSLATLRPIKQQLAQTDALIDQIVYKLYGLTDEEIALIERPQYEQALGEAKEAVLADKKIKAGSDEAVDEIAEKVLPAARRLLGRVDARPERAQLDADLPGWHLLPGDVPTFLETAEYNIRHLPDHLDFSTSVIAYAKAVETVLFDRLFVRFRDEAGCGDGGCNNKFLKQFVAGEREHLTLGSISIILQSSKETALRDFARRVFYKADERFFGDGGVAAQLADEAAVQLRNKAAHDEVLGREAAQQARAWALAILRNL